MMTEAKPIHDNGFTLLEVIAALSILGVGLLAIATMQITAIRVNASAGGLTEATIYAQDRMETLMSLDYDGLNDGGSPETKGNGYTIAWDVTEDSPITDCKRIVVTATWQDKGITKVSQLICIKPKL